MRTRVCTRCGETKPLETEFYPIKSRTTGKSHRDGQSGYIWECKACASERGKRKYRANRERIAAKAKEWRAKNKDKMRAATARHRQKYPERIKENGKLAASLRRIALKAEMMAAYGGACSCCGETNEVFLTLDHVGGGGAEHRKRVGPAVYGDLKKRGWPKDGFRVLCMNCNWASRGGAMCPHEVFSLRRIA